MIKKLFIASILLGVSVLSFAQEPTAEIKSLAKTIAENEQKEMLENMSLGLKGDRKVKVRHLGGRTSCDARQQFLFQKNMIDKILNVKSYSLKAVFEEMRKKHAPSEFTFESMSVGQIKYKTKKDKVDTSAVIVPISFQTHTIAKNNVSDVKYAVTFNWRVEDKGVNGKEVQLETYFVEPINFLSSEKITMLNTAKAKIIEWYATLPQTLDKQYSEQSIFDIHPISLTADEIKANMPAGRNFIIVNVKDIRIDIDPYQFINDSEKHLYTDPSAYIMISPIFNITVDESLKTANIKVEYSVKELVKPVADSEKIARRDAAEATIAKLSHELSSYVASRGELQKVIIRNMFNANDGNVESSYLYPSGKERISFKNVPKYLSLLKGESLNFIDYNIEDVDNNWEKVVYIVDQHFKSKSYSDYTQKKVYLTYDVETRTYYIEKIEVVPNSTKK